MAVKASSDYDLSIAKGLITFHIGSTRHRIELHSMPPADALKQYGIYRIRQEADKEQIRGK